MASLCASRSCSSSVVVRHSWYAAARRQILDQQLHLSRLVEAGFRPEPQRDRLPPRILAAGPQEHPGTAARRRLAAPAARAGAPTRSRPPCSVSVMTTSGTRVAITRMASVTRTSDTDDD